MNCELPVIRDHKQTLFYEVIMQNGGWLYYLFTCENILHHVLMLNVRKS